MVREQPLTIMQDRPRLRLLKLVKKDGGKDRMLYRLYVAARIADNGSHEHFVMDYLDPAFVAINPGGCDPGGEGEEEGRGGDGRGNE